MQSKEKLVLMSLCVLTALLVTQADATLYDTFYIKFDSSGKFVVGGGSGYDGTGDGNGDWYYYPNTDWWNEWFYDHPYDPTRWKEIEVFITVVSLDEQTTSTADIVVNWSSDLYPGGTGTPPLPPLDPAVEAEWIVRTQPLFTGPLDTEPLVIEKTIIIEDYNPEWVSIDIRGTDIIAYGMITHYCVPEPTTLALLGIGGLVTTTISRRRMRSA